MSDIKVRVGKYSSPMGTLEVGENGDIKLQTEKYGVCFSFDPSTGVFKSYSVAFGRSMRSDLFSQESVKPKAGV